MIELEVPEPLADLFRHCETECVRECCGIDAISGDADSILDWARKAGSVKALQARDQVSKLIAVTEDCCDMVTCTFLNHCTSDEQAREQLLAFLGEFRIALEVDFDD